MGLTHEAVQRMRDAVGDDEHAIADILQSFVDEVDGLLGQLTAAAASDDLKTLYRIAHTLKSSCLDLGDEATGDLCARLESDARTGKVLDAGAASKTISGRVLALKSEVGGYLASRKGGSGRMP